MEQLQPQSPKMNLLIYRDFSKNVSATLAFIKQNYGAILKGVCFFLPLSIIAAFFMPSSAELQERMFDAMRSGPFAIFGAYGWDTLLAYLLIGIASLLSLVYVVSYMAEYQLGETTEVNQSAVWSRFGKAIFPVFVSGILYYILVIIGSIFCLIPGLIVAALCYFFSYSAVEEGSSITGCLKRSYELVKADWLNAVLFGIVSILIFGLISSIFSSGIYIVQIMESISGESVSQPVSIGVTMLSFMGSALVAPLLHIAAGMQYFALRRKNDLESDGVSAQEIYFESQNAYQKQNEQQNQYRSPSDDSRYNQY